MRKKRLERVSFWDVFEWNAAGKLSPWKKINIGGRLITPNQYFHKGGTIAGVDLYENVGHDLDVYEREDGVIVLESIYTSK